MEEQLKRPAMMMKKITAPEKKSLHVHAAASGKTCFTNLPEAPAVMVTTPTKAAAAHAQSKRMLGSRRTAASCLCSPTTHAGSFRCRLHRGGGGLPGSVGCGLSEIGKKPGV
ncbi:hypothetical protein GUJ93_ZPchr0012g22082 [Zizania palustris]|uniref:Uncharacterized protein n=1 Tax=Zizania palustris TaxID=103762 RepID=A0A8J5WWS3_ZIZPA|nr:hypothetical protein GUJ93_ZPchr0012g20532 [Zizania palustris]KAG8094758.1 hypothetical protein GUJ93_ZPchr0012g22082 [Zizania palustris]